jgi:hypothetical protein
LSTPAVIPGLLLAGQDIINSALRLIGVLPSGESPSQAESQDALAIANQMFDSWQAESLMISAIQRYVFNPAALKQTYTVGPGGDVNIQRPARIPSIGVINLPGSSQPTEIPLDMFTYEQWRDIPVKNTAGALPERCWDDCAYPLRNLNFWPIPNVQINFALYLWTLITQFPDLITLFGFPPAYLRAIRYNLAVDLAAEFPGNPELMPLVIKIAGESKSIVKTMNWRPLIAACDPALVNPKMDLYNWLTDLPAGR